MEENTTQPPAPTPDTSALFKALIAVQMIVQNPIKDTKGYSYKYAQLDQLIELSKKELANHGLGLLILPVGKIENNCMTVKVTIFHQNGTHLVDHFQVPLKKGSNPTQDFGSAYTYARRYATLGVLNVAPEDDDGQGSQRPNNDLVRKAKSRLEKLGGWEWAEIKGFDPETSTDPRIEKFLKLSDEELKAKIAEVSNVG
jgi:hypothetical protein